MTVTFPDWTLAVFSTLWATHILVSWRLAVWTKRLEEAKRMHQNDGSGGDQ